MSSDQFLRSPAFVRWLGAGAVLILVLGVVRIATHDSSSNSPASGGPPAAGQPTIGPHHHRHHHHQPAPTPTPSAVQPPTTAVSSVAPQPRHHGGGSISTTPTAASSQPSTGGGSGGVGGGGGGGSTPASHPTHSSTAGSESGSSIVVPKFGAYPYATTGGEQAIGSSRTYPSHTTVKYAKDRSCVSATWRPIRQHQEVQVVCPSGSNAIRLKTESQTLSFFGFTTTQTLHCDSKAIIYSTSLKPGDKWSFTCTSNGTKAKQRASAIGFRTFSVGGKSVRALHIHIASTITGSDTGTSTEDIWYAPSLGLPVKTSMKVNAKQGRVTYSGHYTLTLTSTKPN